MKKLNSILFLFFSVLCVLLIIVGVFSENINAVCVALICLVIALAINFE